MLRELFRIGFGGCGCKLKTTFDEYAKEWLKDALQEHYEKLNKWKELLPEKEQKKLNLTKLGLLGKLKETLKNWKGLNFLDTLEEVEKELKNLEKELDKLLLERLLPYEKDVVEGIKNDVEKAKKDIGEFKEHSEVLLKGTSIDSTSTDKDSAEASQDVFFYNSDTEIGYMVADTLGRNIFLSRGFDHHPELQLLPLSIERVQSKVSEKIYERCKSQGEQSGYFSFVGLGGGTGTGLIGVIAERFTKVQTGLLPFLVLAVLSGKDDEGYVRVQQPWYRRGFSTFLALNDILATEYLTGIILIDNEKVIEKKIEEIKEIKTKFSDDKAKEFITKIINEEIIREIGIMFDETIAGRSDPIALRNIIRGGGKRPPIFVPCYAAEKEKIEIKKLIEKAKKYGKLADYDGEGEVEKVFIFIRGEYNLSNKELSDVAKLFNKNTIFIDNNIYTDDNIPTDEIIIDKFSDPDELKNKIEKYDIIIFKNIEVKAIEDKNEVLVLLKNPSIKLSKDKMQFNNEMLSKRLKNAKNFVDLLDKLVELIEKDRERDLLFTCEFRDKERMVQALAQHYEKNVFYQPLIDGLNEERVTEGLKRIFEDSKHFLENPEIKVIQDSSKWIIVDKETYLIQKEDEKLNVCSGESEEIAKKIIDNIVNNYGNEQGQIKEILDQILKEEGRGGENEVEKILNDAKGFLFLSGGDGISEIPEEKREEIYERSMKKFIEKVKEKMECNGNEEWPIFKPRFEIEEIQTQPENFLKMLENDDVVKKLKDKIEGLKNEE